MKKIRSVILLVLAFVIPATCPAQAADSLELVKLNARIDMLVVAKDTSALDQLYAADFVFSHGSGRVEGKAGWMRTVARADYRLRQHDSVVVELHAGIGIVKGKMDIEKANPGKVDRYHLRYVRVFANREKKWILVSHQTTWEMHD